MIRYLATMLFACSAVALGSSGNISRVNGAITVEPGQLAGDVSTVNGSITLGEDARARDVETVNGSVTLHARAQAHAVETVNGGVSLAEDVLMTGNLEAVNGTIRLGPGARVDGSLENVNGDIDVDGAAVRGGIGTTNGDIRIGAGSRVDGGIHVEKPGGWGWQQARRLPRVSIESGAVVNGTLHFEREVELVVASDATVGSIEGVAPRRVQ